jgi:hypothetical protein
MVNRFSYDFVSFGLSILPNQSCHLLRLPPLSIQSRSLPLLIPDGETTLPHPPAEGKGNAFEKERERKVLSLQSSQNFRGHCVIFKGKGIPARITKCEIKDFNGAYLIHCPSPL